MNLPDNAILCDSIHYVNGEVLFRFNPELISEHPLGWISFDETGEIAEINDDLQLYWGSVLLTNKEGTSTLLYYGNNEENCLFYAYSDGKLKKLMDTTSSFDFGLYERKGETYLVVYTDQTVYRINASGVNIDTIENAFSAIEMPDYVLEAVPYSNDDILCILSGGTLLHWNGKKSDVLCDDVRFVWSDCRRVVQNNLRIY